jgi:predicted MFS family arabinose efflux permease
VPTLLHHYRNSFSNLSRNAWILSIAMFINRSGSMVLLFTSLYLTRELHFTIGQAGLIMSFYGFGSILGSYTGGWLTDRYSYFRIMVGALIGAGLILFLILLVKSFAAIAAVVFAYGFAADMFRPANSTAIAAYSTPENRTRSVSLVRLAVNLGFFVGPAIGGFIAFHFGYRWLFIIDSCSSFSAALMLFNYLPRTAPSSQLHDKAVLADSSTSAYRDRRYLFFIILVAAWGTCFFQLFASIPQYFNRVAHYNEDTIGLLLALNGILVVVIEMPLVAALEKRKRSFTYIIYGSLCIPVAFALLMFGHQLIVFAVLYTFVITMAEIFCMPFMMNFVLSRPAKERQGQYSALYSIAFGIAIAIAPSLGLGLADRFGFDTMFIFLISLSLVVAMAFWWVKGREY